MIFKYFNTDTSARGEMFIAVENGHGDTSSKPGFGIALIPLAKV